jgi:hypothetical protein
VEGSHPMTAWDRRGLQEDAMVRALDDWLHVADFVSIARRTGVTRSESLRAIALGLIAEMLVQDLMVAGDADQSGFHDWELSPGDATQRIVETWSKDDLAPSPGAVAWFRNTSKGDNIGEAVAARESC